LDGTVYQAPDLYTFLHSKLIGIIDPLRNAFLEAIEMTRFFFVFIGYPKPFFGDRTRLGKDPF